LLEQDFPKSSRSPVVARRTFALTMIDLLLCLRYFLLPMYVRTQVPAGHVIYKTFELFSYTTSHTAKLRALKPIDYTKNKHQNKKHTPYKIQLSNNDVLYFLCSCDNILKVALLIGQLFGWSDRIIRIDAMVVSIIVKQIIITRIDSLNIE
jgi:hypothetical protein